MERNRNINIIILLVLVSFSSCKEKSNTNINQPDVNFKLVESDSRMWWNYHNNNINLSSDFVAFNEFSKEIPKQEFLKKLVSGKYIALKLKNKNNRKYQLFSLSDEADKEISKSIENVASIAYSHFGMETTAFPEFSVTDLNGKNYDNNFIKGKTVIIKTWFISCKPCIEEFPELNDLVKNYKDREDIIFLSLALDSKSDLENFLNKKEFKYKVVPDQTEFIEEKLKLRIYPTHMVVNKNGKIIKVVNKASEMFLFLDSHNILTLEEGRKSPPPPPPSSN